MSPNLIFLAALVLPGADAKAYAKPELLFEGSDLAKQAKTFPHEKESIRNDARQ